MPILVLFLRNFVPIPKKVTLFFSQCQQESCDDVLTAKGSKWPIDDCKKSDENHCECSECDTGYVLAEGNTFCQECLITGCKTLYSDRCACQECEDSHFLSFVFLKWSFRLMAFDFLAHERREGEEGEQGLRGNTEKSNARS